jgi:hypothetical protein
MTLQDYFYDGHFLALGWSGLKRLRSSSYQHNSEQLDEAARPKRLSFHESPWASLSMHSDQTILPSHILSPQHPFLQISRF